MESFLDPALSDTGRADSDYTQRQLWSASISRANHDDEGAHQLAVAQLAALEQSVAEHTAAAVSGAYILPPPHQPTAEALDLDGLLLNQPPARKRKKNADPGDESELTESPVKRGAASSKAHDMESLESKVPKKRGRPKGSKDKPRDPEDGKPRPKRGRPPGTKNKPRDPFAPDDPNKKTVGRPRKYPPGTTRRDKKRIRELEEEAKAIAELAAGMGGGQMPSLSNQGGMEASTSGKDSSGGSETRGEEEQTREPEQEQPNEEFGIAVDEAFIDSAHDMHLELLAGMGLPSTSSAPFMPTFDAPRHSSPLILPHEHYSFDPGEQQDQDIPTGFISSRPGPTGEYGASPP